MFLTERTIIVLHGALGSAAQMAPVPFTIAGFADWLRATLGTKFAWSPDVATREAARLDAGVIGAKVPRFAAMLEARHARAGGWELTLRNTASLLTALGADPPLDPPALASVRARVMLGVGDADDTVDAAETERFTAMIRGATSRVVPGTPHPIERVAPDQVVSLVRDVSGG